MAQRGAFVAGDMNVLLHPVDTSGFTFQGGIARSCGWGRVVRRRPLIRGSSSQLGFRL